MYNAKKRVPWSSTLVVQESLIALDIEVSLQPNQSNLYSQQAQIHSAAFALYCSVQRFAQVLNVNHIPNRGVKYILRLCKCPFFLHSVCSRSRTARAGFPETFCIHTADRHGSCFFHWLGFKQQPTLQLRWDPTATWFIRSVGRNKYDNSPEAVSHWCNIGSISRAEHLGGGGTPLWAIKNTLHIYVNSIVHGFNYN